MSSYNTPVRDELVVNLGDIMPELKSSRGIPVVKHTKRGQSENRRLRLDTDLSTLEVFSTNTGYLNRRISTRTHNLCHLEEVGPAESVPGGLPATPGRTLHFVFRNRNLFVTVKSRDVGAALVALFRGGASGSSSMAPSAAPGAAGRRNNSRDDIADTSRRRLGLNSSPSVHSIVDRQARNGPSRGRLLSATMTSQSSRTLDRETRSSADPVLRHIGGRDGGGRTRGRGIDGESDYGRMGPRGRSKAKLKRSASYSAGPDSFADVSSSSDDIDDDDDIMGVPTNRTPTLSGTSGRSSVSTHSSESPDPIMRSRMVGFGPTLENAKPKKGPFKPPWSRRGGSEGEKRGSPATTASTSERSSGQQPAAVPAVEEKATVVPPDSGNGGSGGKRHGGGASSASSEGLPGRTSTKTALPSPVTANSSNGVSSKESVAIRRPASDPSVGVPASTELSPVFMTRKEDVAAVSSSKVVTAGAGATSGAPPSSGDRGGNRTESQARTSPRSADKRRHSSDGSRAGSAAAQQQLPPASPLQAVEDLFNFQPRPGSPRRGPKQKKQASQWRDNHGNAQQLLVIGGERRIPPLQRPIGTDGQQQHDRVTMGAVDQSLVAVMSRDSTDEGSMSPPLLQQPRDRAHGWENGSRQAMRVSEGGAAAAKAMTRVVTSSSSFDTVEEYNGKREDRGSMESTSTSNSPDCYEMVPALGATGGARPLGKTTGRSRDAREGKDAAEEKRESTERNAREAREARNAKILPSAGSRGSRGDGRVNNPRLKDMIPARDAPLPGTPGRLLTRPRNKPMSNSQDDVSATSAESMLLGTAGANAPLPTHDVPPQLFQEAVAGAAREETAHYDPRRESVGGAADGLYSPVVAGPMGANKLTIEASSPLAAGPGLLGAIPARDTLPFLSGISSLASHGSRGTDCTSPDSPPGGAVGEVRKASVSSPPVPPRQPRPIPIVSRGHIGSAPQLQEPKGPSGFEELWAVLEPAWGINASFGTSMTPKVMLLGEIYDMMRNFQTAVSSVCVRACGPTLAEVCGRCGRAWAVLSSASQQALADFTALHKIGKGVDQLIAIVERYETSAVIRRFTLSLIRSDRPMWDEMLSAGEGADLQGPCRQIEEAVALLPVEGKTEEIEQRGNGDGGGDGSEAGGGNSRGGRGHMALGGAAGGRNANGRGSIEGWSEGHLWLPPCPSYWAKGQFDRLTPRGLPDVVDLLHDPVRFGELARLVTRASDEGPLNKSYSPAWDCVRQAEGPSLGRALRRALSATLVDAGEFLPLPRVPPPPVAYLPRDRLANQIEATILHPFLPLGIAGIGGPSGSGKTVLAAAVVRREAVRRRFGDRVFWLHAGRGADKRIISMVQTLADTVYAWLTDSEKGSQAAVRGGRGGGGSNVGGGGGGGRGGSDDLREPVRFRDEDQAIQYVADLCQGPRLGKQGLRCLVVLDDVHEEVVVKTLWKSQCQLLVISPVSGLLQAVGAEATLAERFSDEDAHLVAAAASGEESLCSDGARLVNLCEGSPLAVAMAGALAQTAIHAAPTQRRGDGGGDGAGKREGLTQGRGWSLSGVTQTVNILAAPVGAWVEQAVGLGGSSDRRVGSGGRGDGSGGGADGVSGVTDQRTVSHARRRPSLHSLAWTDVARKVDVALSELESNRGLRKVMDESGPGDEKSARAMQVVLTQVALAQADAILGGSELATRCYLSFVLLPDGFPLPPPALEEFWRPFDPAAAGNPRGNANSFSNHQDEPGVVQVLAALRLVGRAGGGEGAAGLAPHGFQRRLLMNMANSRKDIMDEMLRRRVWILSRISSLTGTFDDQCWALGGGGDAMGCVRAGGGLADGSSGEGASREGRLQLQGGEETSGDGDSIPAGLLGSGPGPPSHGYGGFSRYDYLVASWEALPPSHTLAAAASRYLDSVRAACRTALDGGGGGGCRWAAARALASAADLQALSDRGSTAIPAYEEACRLLAAEATSRAQAAGVPQWQRAARDTLHKVATMVQDLALLAAQFRKEAPAIRLLQRAVEIHLSVLASSGGLLPDLGDPSAMRKSLLYDPNKSPGGIDSPGGADREVEEAAQILEASRGRGAGITWKAVANDDRSLALRLRPQSPEGGEEPIPAGRGTGGGVGAGWALPAFGRLDVVATCVGDLGRIVSCMRQLRQANRVDESVQLAEKVFPVLREILGAEHAFTKAALAGLVGQGIVDKCWTQQGAEANDSSPLGPGQQPALPSPTSRRKQARSYEGRGGGTGGGVMSAEKRSNSALSALSSPPSPLPQQFYTPTQNTAVVSSGSASHASYTTPHGPNKDRNVAGGGGRRGDGGTGRFSFAGIGSDSSGSDGDDLDDDDSLPRNVGALGAGPARRGAGRVGRGSHQQHHLIFKRSLERPLQGWQREAHLAWQRSDAPPLSSSAAAATAATAALGVGARAALHPASTLMQHDRYIRHLIRRARAHAFLITAATRARIKDADRTKAGLFLLDMARQASSQSLGSGSGGGAGSAGAAISPEGSVAEQIPRLTAAWD